MYKCETWNYFIQKEEKKDIVGLLKSIFKSEKYKLKPSRLVAERGGEKKQYSAILFYKVYDLAEKIKKKSNRIILIIFENNKWKYFKKIFQLQWKNPISWNLWFIR